MTADTMMTTPRGELELRRLPDTGDGPLRAWDAADEYLLEHLDTAGVEGDRWLIVNDRFGALGAGLVNRRPQSWGDSVTSHHATLANLERNGLDVEAVGLVPSTEIPEGPIDVVVLKVPRTLALLEDQLRILRPLLHADSVIVAGGMVKAIHRSTLEAFEQSIGPSPTSLAKKKARLVHTTFDAGLAERPSPYPTRYELDDGSMLIEHANVFARGHLDIGTRAMLEHLPSIPDGVDLLDLGCGNGLLGLTAARRCALRSLCFVDESYQAIASARANAEAWSIDAPTTFVADRTLASVPSGSIDVVLNNPPFHAHQSRSDDTAKRMFADAYRVLRPGGSLVVVGNRHLDYHKQLRRRFGQSEIVGSTPKFVVLRARR